MKKAILGLLVAAMPMVSIMAQKPEIAVKESNVANSGGSANCLTAELVGTQAKDAQKNWEKFIKKYKNEKVKYDKKTDETLCDNCEMKEVTGSNNTVDVIAKFTQNGANTTMMVWFNLGGAYLSSQQHPQGYPVAEKIVKEFALTVSKGLVEEELKAEMKKLKDIEDQKKDLAKDKGRLEKDIEGYKKDIEEYKKKIEKAEKDIETTKGKIGENEKAQELKQKEVDAQSGAVKKVEDKLKDFK